jgi:hypothetical protein
VVDADAFVEELAKFKIAREAHIRSRVEQAQRELEAAKGRLTALEGAQ